jgi:hypothetical protein
MVFEESSPPAGTSSPLSIPDTGLDPASPLRAMGPIDYLVVEFPGRRSGTGSGLRMLVDLVDRGIIRVLDLVFIRKELDGTVLRLELADLLESGQDDLLVFQGASSGILNQDDIDATGEVIQPDSGAALLLYENSWAAPLAIALNREGGQLVANGRIPTQALVAALDAASTQH